MGVRNCTRLGKGIGKTEGRNLAILCKEKYDVVKKEDTTTTTTNTTITAASSVKESQSPRKRRREAAVTESAKLLAARSKHVVIGRPEWELADMGNDNYTKTYTVGKEVGTNKGFIIDGEKEFAREFGERGGGGEFDTDQVKKGLKFKEGDDDENDHDDKK